MRALVRTTLGLCLGWLATRLVAAWPVARPATRRAFVRNAALGAAGVALAEAVAAVGAFAWPTKTGAFGGVLTVAAADVPAAGGPPFRSAAGRFYLVRTGDGLLALWSKCPHLGCTVPWVGPPDSPAAFHCPCHGSRYDYAGVLTHGPAPRPLDLMAVTVDATGNVAVDTGAITTRAGYEPRQAVPYPT